VPNKLIILLLFLLQILGCRHQLQHSKPVEMQPPPQWSAKTSTVEGEPSVWLDSFNAPQLFPLINEALQQNFSLQSAAARIRAAQARARQAGAALLPDAALDGSAARRKIQGSGSTIDNSFALTGRIQWDIDLWNRLDLEARAAGVEAAAAADDYRAAQLSLAARIARSWFRLIEVKLQQQLSAQTVSSYRQSLQVIEEQYRRGLNSALDLRLARSQLSSAEATLAERNRLFDNEQRTLEQLLGRYPAGTLAATDQLPELTEAIPVGLPSSLLQRRPDVRAAELRLQAVELRAAAEERNWLPGFSLTGTAGTASDRLYQLLDWDTLVWSLAASLSQSLFDGGRDSAARQLAAAQRDEQLTGYAETLLNAFREVETALATEASLQNQQQALAQTVSEAEEAEQLAEQRYRQGLEGIITLLETQRRAFSARSSLLQTSRLRLENRVDLHLALAGPLNAATQLPAGMERP